MPDKNPPAHRCCCLLISSSATPLVTSASCQSRRHSVDGWLVGHQNKTRFPLQLISFIAWRVKLYLWRFNVHRLLVFPHRLAPPSLPRLRHTFFKPIFKENCQLQQKVLVRPRQHRGREGRGSRLSRWARSSPPSCRPGSETSRSAPRCSCAEI